MQSWIHVLEWRANVRPEVMALTDDRGASHTYAQLFTAGPSLIDMLVAEIRTRTAAVPRTTTGKVLKRELRVREEVQP